MKAWTLELPGWFQELEEEAALHVYPAVEDRMGLAIELSRRNVAEGTGGPFGAAVFETAGWRLVAPGINLVEAAGTSVAHAEIVALLLAQRTVGGFDLGAAGLPGHELVASTEPCSMCLGAIPWAGLARVVTGAHDEDARRIGFDEGAKPPDWVAALMARGIEVVRSVRRAEARAVLESYVAAGGKIYNGRAGRG